MSDAEKLRVLFVDDDPMVLSGLRRTMRRQRSEWDMDYATSGAEALSKMEENKFDAIVTDMRMPAMNGAELLAEVASRFPKTIRFVLSGYADQELIGQCIGTAHQYLSKPCEPLELVRALDRALALESRIKNEKIQQFVGGLDQLPMVPETYSELVAATQDPEMSVDAVGEIVAKDVGMTANLLKLVNSAFFGLRRSISTAGEAAAYLGTDKIKHIVLSLKLYDQFGKSGPAPIDVNVLWKHSLDVANAAHAVARMEEVGEPLYSQCFLAGMLHDIGKLVLSANMPDEYRCAIEMAETENISLCAAEEAVLSVNHGDVGGCLMGLWGLPDLVVEAVAWHHSPLEGGDCSFGPLMAVHITDAVVDAIDSREVPLGEVVPPCTEYLAGAGLLERFEFWKSGIAECLNPTPEA